MHETMDLSFPNNLVELFLGQTRRLNERTALRYKKEGRWVGITWKEWEREVKLLALGLVELGLQPKEKVSLLSENRPEWLYFDLATQAAGGILVSVYATLTAAEVRYINHDALVRFAVVEDVNQLEKVLSTVDSLPDLERIILIEGASDDSRVVTYSQLLQMGAEGDEKDLEQRYEAIEPHDVATYVYTSGTTGEPKGAMITHDNILFISASTLQVFEIKPSDSAISFLPLSHVYERVGGFYTALRAGIEISFAESIEKMTANLLEVRPTILCSVPRVLEKAHAAILAKTASGDMLTKTLFNWALAVGRKTSPFRLKGRKPPLLLRLKHRLAKLLVYDKIAGRFGGRLRFIAVAGAPMSREITEFFHALNIFVLEGYGMTENAAPVSLNTFDHVSFGTVGRPLPGVDLKIAPDGEILLRGRSVFAGYFGKPEETAEALEGGWLHTGDIGDLDEDGMLRIVDRKKDIIVTSGGKNIAPQKIENMLIADPYINQIMVIGDNRKFLTAVISPAMDAVAQYAHEKGFEMPDRSGVVNHPEVNRLIQSRVDLVNKDLPRFEAIKYFRLLRDDLSQETGELTPTLKVKRKVVMGKYHDMIERMYAVASEAKSKDKSS